MSETHRKCTHCMSKFYLGSSMEQKLGGEEAAKTSDTIIGWESIRILHECEVLIEKSVPRVTVWHHEALPSDAKLTRGKDLLIST